MKKKCVLLLLVLHRHNSPPTRPLSLDFAYNSLTYFFVFLVQMNTFFHPHGIPWFQAMNSVHRVLGEQTTSERNFSICIKFTVKFCPSLGAQLFSEVLHNC